MARILRLPIAILSVLVVTAGLCCAVSPASAQGFGWFGNLFGGGAPRQRAPAAPAYPTYATPAPNIAPEYPRPYRHATRHRPVDQVQREAPPKEKAPPKNASMFVYVFGDSLGQQLASGLDDALADRSDVAVIHKARGSTGLVMTDFYDWPKAIADLLAEPDSAGKSEAGKHEPDKHDVDKREADKREADKREADKHEADKHEADKHKGDHDKAERDKGERADQKLDEKSRAEHKPKIDVAVMMIGTNDRQPIQADGKTFQPGTPEWTAIYTKRVMAIDDAFQAKHIPLIWVGLPITKDDDFADDMAAFNDVYRNAAAKTGATYVDTWEAFSDDNGDFSTYGPDINGQTVRLRAADGIHFTRAGARKLAHFVEVHVRRALENETPAPQLPTAEEAGSGKAVATVRPDVGPIRNLNEPPSAANGLLLSASAKPGGATDPQLARGDTAPVPAGRADDARWPGKMPAEP